MAQQSLKNIYRLIETATKQRPPEQSFVADLEMVIEKVDSADSRKPSKYYKPSSMACIRNMYFQRIGANVDAERANANLVGICETGSARHQHIQAYLQRMKSFGVDCEFVDVEKFIKLRHLDYLEVTGKTEYETKVFHKDLNLSFLCDGIIKYLGQYYIFEFKTETLYKWQTRNATAPEHVVQGTAYSLSFGIDQVLFVYENRDNCSKKAFILQITDDMKFELVLSKIEECDKFVAKFIVPPKPKDVSKKTCEYCSYKLSCQKAGSE